MSTISPWTWLFLSSFALLSCLHALSLRRVIPWSFRTHLRVMGSLWNLWNAGIVALVLVLPPTTPMPADARAVGVVLVLVGLVVSIWHRLLLGRARFYGGRCFSRQYDTHVAGGLYKQVVFDRWLRHPVYDGIILAFVGLTLWRENTDFLLLAVSSFLLLNVFMARIEGAPSPHHA